jgi:DNA-binding MarR family transcriptional regulator
MARRRNTLLQALEHFRRLSPTAVVNDLIIFLYVCENEGINITELARVGRITEATASRRARALCSLDNPNAMPPALGLIDFFQGADGRTRLLYLSEKGRALKAEMEGFIASADPIAPEDRRAGETNRLGAG